MTENAATRVSATDSENEIVLGLLGAVGSGLLLVAIALFVVAATVIRRKHCGHDAVAGEGR